MFDESRSLDTRDAQLLAKALERIESKEQLAERINLSVADVDRYLAGAGRLPMKSLLVVLEILVPTLHKPAPPYKNRPPRK